MYELHSQAFLILRLEADAKAKKGSGLIEVSFVSPDNNIPVDHSKVSRSYSTLSEQSRDAG